MALLNLSTILTSLNPISPAFSVGWFVGICVFVIIVFCVVAGLYLSRKPKIVKQTIEQEQTIRRANATLDKYMNNKREEREHTQTIVRDGVEISCPNCGERLIWQN